MNEAYSCFIVIFRRIILAVSFFPITLDV